MQIVNKYNYSNLQRLEDSSGRRYIDGIGKKVPSVTTILSATKDMTHINEWIKSVGEERANKIKTEASSLGTEIHKNIENYIHNLSMAGSYMSKVLANTIIKNGLSKVDQVWGIEAGLYARGLYAGTTDLVGTYLGKPAIMDFKNSLKDKKKEWIEDYFLQLCAYAMAHNEMFGTDISCGVVMVVTREAKYQEFVIEGDEFRHYQDKWLERLMQFYDKYV